MVSLPAELRESQALLDTLLAVAPVGFAFLDVQLRYRRVNAALAAMHGLAVEQHLGRTLREVMPAVALDGEALARRALERGEAVVEHEVRGETAAAPGDERCWLASYFPVRDDSGQVLGVLAAVLDVTERRRAETARDRSAEGLALLARASAVLSFSLDWETTLHNVVELAMPALADFGFFDVVERDGEVRRIARAYEDPARQALLEATRWARSERADINLCALSHGRSGFHPSIDDAWMVDVAVAPEHLELMRQLGFRSMITVPLLSGERTLGALTLFYADSGRHHTPADIALAEELARRAAAAVENARLYREAQEAIQARDEFLSVASHELRTPLTTVTAQAQLMLRRFQQTGALDEARAVEALRAIDHQSGKLASLVNQLLNVSRMQTGKLPLDRREIDLAALVQGVVAAIQVHTSRHQIGIRGPLALPIIADPLRLEQVLTNLLDNAVKYSPRGGPIEVELVHPEGGWIEIAVRDFGVGIPPEKRAQIFQRFHRAHLESHASGIGLGLYLSRQIVEQHGGELRAEFPAGGGSRFVVRLPTTVQASPGTPSAIASP